jgi:2-oxoglutarate dehydrogenase complex dehydrogenase (E1) component-like enzyme
MESEHIMAKSDWGYRAADMDCLNSTPLHESKSSALTLLFHGLDKDSLDGMTDVGSTNREKELKKISTETKVQLVLTSQGWKLSTTDIHKR